MRDGEWHHIVVTKNGSTATLYVDGTQEHSTPDATDSGDPAASPWHVMRNGSNDAYSAGEADELALYTRALSEAEVDAHYELAQDLADDPLPSSPPGGGTPPGTEPPAGGSGPDGGSPGTTPGGNTPAPRTGTVLVRRGALIARGAPGVRNNITARRRGRRWIVSDRLARLRAGAGCRRVTARSRELPRIARPPNRPLRRRRQRPPHGDRPHPRDLPRRPGARRHPPRALAHAQLAAVPVPAR